MPRTIHLPAPRWTPILTLDRSPSETPRSRKTNTTVAERIYAKQLTAVARHVGEIINGFEPGDIEAVPSLVNLLRRYAEALTPWAQRTAAKMIGEVDLQDRAAWRALGNRISSGIRDLLLRTPVGEQTRALLGEQVMLIQSLPIEAGQRVHDLTLKGLEDSTRAKEIAEQIEASGEVTKSRALLIARTEVSRTSSVFVQTRAEHAGSTQYIWRTSHDGDVRPGHRAMEGKVCDWANPPAVNENGRIMHFHAGQIWNCRCYPEPIF